jgi:hypothetical protein
VSEPEASPVAESPDETPRPQPAGPRRHREPHRARLLLRSGWAGLACAGLAFLVWPAGVAAIPVGAVTWLTACQDLARMRAGLMDPGGERDAEGARFLAWGAAGIGLIAVLLRAPWASAWIRQLP